MGTLRFLLALSVVFFHFNEAEGRMVGGSMAVQSFYVISGFYMALILNEKYLAGKGSYSLFISNRLLRLYPLYLLIVLMTLGSYFMDKVFFNYTSPFLQNLNNHSDKFSPGTWLYLILSNSTIVGQETALFLGLDNGTGQLYFTGNFHGTNPEVNSFMIIGQAWTIGIELLFYFIAPFIVRRKAIVLFAFLGMSLLLRMVIYSVFHMKYDPWTYRFFPTELAYFLMGSLAYKFYIAQKKWQIPQLYLVGLYVFMVAFTIFYMEIFKLLAVRPLYQSLLHLIYAVSFVVFLPFIFRLTARHRLDRQIGELSYPIYMVHALVLYWNMRWQLNSLFFVITTTVVLSFLFDTLFMKKMETYRQSRVKA
ncbi:MAG: acyltransferase [Spirosomataceae bacterium]